MEVKEILEILRNYYWDKTERSEESTLTSTENCAFYAVLKTLSKEQLEEANGIMSDFSMPLTLMVGQSLNPTSQESLKKNDRISILIDRFVNKKSKCVGESRKEILRRYAYQDFSIQKKIIKAFLSSNAVSDVEWAAAEADKQWDKSYSDYIRNAYDKNPSRKLAITVIRRMPIEYVKSNESSLVMHSRSEFCIRMADESDALIHKYDLTPFEILYVKARIGQRPNQTEMQLEKQFFRHIYVHSLKLSMGIYNRNFSIDKFPWINRAVWALGELGYRRIIMRFLELKKYLMHEYIREPNCNELYLIQKWISENYFPDILPYESINWDKLDEQIEKIKHPRSVTVESISDLDKYDDLPPDNSETFTEFI